MTTARARRHEATRREILEVAWRHAEESGIAGISLRDIAGEVGMRAPSLYTYFESKDAIYDAMFAEGYRALITHYEGFAERFGSLDRRAALTTTVEGFIDFCQASQARYQLMFTRAIPGWEPSEEAYAVSLASYGEAQGALATMGVEGQDRLDLYIAVTAGLAAQQMSNDPTGDRWRRLASDAVEMLVGYLDQGKGETP
jgi:AcrR family transcriptional regulator